MSEWAEDWEVSRWKRKTTNFGGQINIGKSHPAKKKNSSTVDSTTS